MRDRFNLHTNPARTVLTLDEMSGRRKSSPWTLADTLGSDALWDTNLQVDSANGTALTGLADRIDGAFDMTLHGHGTLDPTVQEMTVAGTTFKTVFFDGRDGSGCDTFDATPGSVSDSTGITYLLSLYTTSDGTEFGQHCAGTWGSTGGATSIQLNDVSATQLHVDTFVGAGQHFAGANITFQHLLVALEVPNGASQSFKVRVYTHDGSNLVTTVNDTDNAVATYTAELSVLSLGARVVDSSGSQLPWRTNASYEYDGWFANFMGARGKLITDSSATLDAIAAKIHERTPLGVPTATTS